jgi:hypothetical protein
MMATPRTDDFYTPPGEAERAFCRLLLVGLLDHWPYDYEIGDPEPGSNWWPVQIVQKNDPFDFRRVLSMPQVETRFTICFFPPARLAVWYELQPQEHSRWDQSNYAEYPPILWPELDSPPNS